MARFSPLAKVGALCAFAVLLTGGVTALVEPPPIARWISSVLFIGGGLSMLAIRPVSGAAYGAELLKLTSARVVRSGLVWACLATGGLGLSLLAVSPLAPAGLDVVLLYAGVATVFAGWLAITVILVRIVVGATRDVAARLGPAGRVDDEPVAR